VQCKLSAENRLDFRHHPRSHHGMAAHVEEIFGDTYIGLAQEIVPDPDNLNLDRVAWADDSLADPRHPHGFRQQHFPIDLAIRIQWHRIEDR